MYFIRRLLRQCKKPVKCVFYSTVKNIQNVEIGKVRNIGILAHIDAGNYKQVDYTEILMFII